MLEPRPSPRLRLKFAALGAVGAAMVLLPLGQVLRFQSAELQSLLTERTALDPLSHALAVQRNVIDHREVAERVLRGRAQLELERRLRQGAVDQSLWALHGTLSAGRWVRALGETDTMMVDWRELTRSIALRQIEIADNHTRHELLVEQAVQVMDFVSAAADAASYARLAGLLAPRHTSATDAAAAPAAAPRRAPAQQLAALEDALQARAAELDGRAAALQSQRTALWCAGAAWLGLVLGLWAWLTRAAADGPGGDGVRRSQGRRANDARTHLSESSRLVERLRKGASTPTVEPGQTLPPGA